MNHEEFKQIRELLNVNQTGLGFLLDRKRSVVNSWENNRQEIPKGISYLMIFYRDYGIPAEILSEMFESEEFNYKLVRGSGKSCEGCCFFIDYCRCNDDNFIDLCDKKNMIYKKR